MTISRAEIPSIEQVLQLEPALRRVAPVEWEDANGHVNVSAYYRFHMDASTRTARALGWTRDYRERTGNSVFSVEQHIRFYDEVLVGNDVSAHFRLLDRNAKLFHGVSILVNRSTERVANTLEFVEGHVSLSERRITPFPAELADQLDVVLAEHQALPWSMPLNRAMGLR